MEFFHILIPILDSTLRYATPLLLACLAGLYSERAGIVDIGLEGKMLGAAFLTGGVAYVTGSIWLGLLAGVAGSMALSLLHGVASITFRGDQLISGVAINFLAAGLSIVIGAAWFQLGGRTPSLPSTARFQDITLPFADSVANVPILGPIYSDLISGHTILVYVALIAVPVTWFVLYRTRFGLRLRAAGENPAAVDTAGVSVVKLRYSAIIIAGILCGLAGVYLASFAANFVKDMTAGRGYIALAALIFAKWRPWQAMGTCILFGFLAAAAPYLENKSFMGLEVPSQFIDALPYMLTVIILAGFVGKAIPPRAGGQPYVKEK